MLPRLMFQAGSHGNFLSRTLSVASGLQEDFDFYASRKGAHNFSQFLHVVDHNHYFKEKDIWCNIEIHQDDLYILMWHTFYAGHNSGGLDLLKINSYENLWKFQEQISKVKEHPCNDVFKQATLFEDNGVSGLREYYKTMHSLDNGLLALHKNRSNEKNISNYFEFKWFYDVDLYIANVKLLLEKLGLEYKVDISNHIKLFLDRKQDIIQSKQLVDYAFTCFIKNIPINISNFCVYQQGYLDYLVERHLGYEIENWESYPTNIRDYNPTKAWVGKKYDL